MSEFWAGLFWFFGVWIGLGIIVSLVVGGACALRDRH
jgi:hypothetical protein